VHANSCPCADRHAAKRGVGVSQVPGRCLWELCVRFGGALNCKSELSIEIVAGGDALTVAAVAGAAWRSPSVLKSLGIEEKRG
jgi:hypothetical protein